MDGAVFTLSLFVGCLGMIGVWMALRGVDALHKNFLLLKFPIKVKAIVNVCDV